MPSDKPMPAAHRDILRIANELGYFPLKSHLKELNISAATIFGEKYPNHRGAIDNAIYLPCVREALEKRYGK